VAAPGRRALSHRYAANTRRDAISRSRRSDVQHHSRWILDAFFHADQEGHGLLAVDQAMIVREGEIHHRADDHLIADDTARFSILCIPEWRFAADSGWGSRAGSRRPAVGDGEGAAAEIGEAELALSRGRGKPFDRLLKLGETQPVGVMHNRNDEPAFGSDRDTEMDVLFVDHISAIDRGVHTGSSLSAPMQAAQRMT